MKKFKYNDVEYTIYNTNEIDGNKYPVVLDNNNICPKGAQKGMLRKLLLENGYTEDQLQDDKNGPHTYCKYALEVLERQNAVASVTGEDITLWSTDKVKVKEILDFLRDNVGELFARKKKRDEYFSGGQLNQNQKDKIEKIEKDGKKTVKEFEKLADLIVSSINDESLELSKNGDNDFTKQDNTKNPTKCVVREYLWLKFVAEGYKESPIFVSLFAKKDQTLEKFELSISYDNKMYANPADTTKKDEYKEKQEKYTNEFNQLKQWAQENSFDMEISINRDDSYDNDTYVNKIIEAAEKIVKVYKHYIELDEQSGGKTKMSQTNEIKDILNSNKQVILTGAPGTGKTFTVKEYVEGKEFKFVQFHPSYDYSDFVEGLRPVPDSTSTTHGNMFVRLDGSFKEFCRKIVMDELQKIKDSGSSSPMSDIVAFEEYRKRYTKVEEENDDHNVTKADEQTEIPNKESTDNNSQENIKQEAAEKQYYFIIDEINRADLSKVFGEIMYCLDEDYRGPENAIQTQYSALNTYHKVIKDDGSGKDITTYEEYDFDCFENGFFIPHNLHIIGTMNDIDRSVESFDFALRRRFIWKEVDANGSINELEKIVTSEKIKSTEMDLSDLKDKAIRINNLFDLEPQAGNKEPEFKDIKRLGLNKQYQLGKAYYKDFDGSKSSLEKIYRGKIEPIIKEYTRGRDANIVKNFLDKVKEILL